MLLPMQPGAAREGRSNEDMIKRLKRKSALTWCGPAACGMHGLALRMCRSRSALVPVDRLLRLTAATANFQFRVRKCRAF